MFKWTWILLFLILTFELSAQPANYTPAEIMLLGTFHLDNPGLDVAKFQSAEVLSDKRQKEINEVISNLKTFKPDIIFVEAPPASQRYYDSLFDSYKNSQFQLKANEIYQLGFRLARELNLDGVKCVDYREATFPFDSLVKVATHANQVDLMMYIKQTIDSIERTHNEQLKRSTIKAILRESNSVRNRNFSVGIYFKFLQAGPPDNHVGSFMASEWWRRNMIIYENILKRLTGKEKRILVIFGASHTALLHEFIKYNSRLKIVEVNEVLH